MTDRSDDDIAELVRQLADIEARIVELTGGSVDAVIDGSGRTMLLRQAQHHLQQRANDYQAFAQSRAAILNALPAHIALLDHDGRIIDVNDSWRRFGADNGLAAPEGGTGANYLQVCEGASGPDGEEADTVAAGIRAVLSGQLEAFSLEYPCHSPDEQRWFRVMASPLPAGVEGAAVVMHIDVTAQKLVEQSLRAREVQLADSETRFRVLAQATLDTVRDWEITSGRLWWNEGIHSQFGYLIDEAGENLRSWSDRIHPEDRDAVLARLDELIAGEESDWEAEYRFLRADGSYANVVDRGHMFRDGAGKGYRMMSGMTDVTQRLSLEEQLRQAQRLEAVGQLTGGVAHDFNNLLTVILGNAELLAEQLGDMPVLEGMADMVRAAAEQGSELTRRLLAFARKQALDPRPTDVNELITGMDNLLRRTLGEHIELALISGPGLWPAMVDPPQLESTLLNLCINARDAMRAGGRLTVDTSNVEIDADDAAQLADVTPGQYVVVAVSDTGTGIDPEVLPRVFEPFFTTKPRGEGSGLGLAMVYGFTRQSGGHVRIYTELGQGTTVKLYLPRAVEPGDQPQLAGSTVPGAGTGIGAGESILLVEDDDAVRALASRLLSSLGYRVITAENGPRALRVLESDEHIDLLFTDIVMPGGLSGRQLADAAATIRPGLKVLYASGYSENAIVHHGRLEPGVLLLGKPYRRAELAGMIRRALERD